MSGNRKWLNFLYSVLMWLLAAVFVFPLYLILTIALKSQAEFARNLFGVPAVFEFSNLSAAWELMNIPSALSNTVILTACSLIFIIFAGSLASFAIARRNSRIYVFFYLFFLAGAMVPFQLTMIPLYKILTNLLLLNTYAGVIFIYTSGALPFAILIFTGFIRGIPRELDESAKMDGCSTFMTYCRIIVPLIVPSIITVGILNLVGLWNDLLVPLLYLGGGKMTLMTGLYSFRLTQYTTDWTMTFAGAVICAAPLVVIFLFFQKYFNQGMLMGAVKG